jgi:hypothetical protein
LEHLEKPVKPGGAVRDYFVAPVWIWQGLGTTLHNGPYAADKRCREHRLDGAPSVGASAQASDAALPIYAMPGDPKLQSRPHLSTNSALQLE